jgi:YfiH family protein
MSPGAHDDQPLLGASGFREHRGLPTLAWPDLDTLGAEVIVTTRAGGVSSGPYESLNLGLHVGDDQAAVLENRRRAAAALGTPLEECIYPNQVHGTAVAVVGRDDRGRGAVGMDDALEADALVTVETGLVLTILVADCVPLVLLDPEARVLAVVHAGWRGTVARIVDAALAAMVELGARPGRIVAGLGPAIGVDRYEVGEEVAEEMRRTFGETSGLLRATRPGHHLLDLHAANRRLLLEAGVPATRISAAPVATGPAGPFFSDRAQRPCGRFGLLARLAR